MAQTTVGNIGIEIKSNVTSSVTAFTNLQNSIKGTSVATKESVKALQTLAGTLSTLKGTLLYSIGFGSLQQSLMTINKLFKTSTIEAVNFVENFNLFNVSLRNNFESALKFQYELNAAFRTNMSETMRYQGFFGNLSSSLKLTNDATSIFAENLTKLTFDLASLFNIDYSTAYSKLASGIIGQTKPLRTLGIDVTQQTLQPYLFEIGINKQVTQLTQAEKVLLRYIAILDQSTNAQGDFARTIESPANQLRILSDQIKEASRWIGTIFMGVLEMVLPYLNAVAIVVAQITKALAMFFGFDISKYNYLAQQDEAFLDMEDSINGAYLANEKLKGSLAGFDELNLISEPTAGNQGAMNTFGQSETYNKLLEAMEGYDNLMGKVNYKATQLAENILTWLGFTKLTNEETGEVTWKLEKLNIFAWGVVSAFGALLALPLVGFVYNIAKFLGFTSGFNILNTLIAKLIPLMTKLGAAIALLNPVAIAITALVVLFAGALIDLWNTSETFREVVVNAFKNIIDIGKKFYDTLKPYIDIVARSFVALWEYGIMPLWQGWKNFVESVVILMATIIDVSKPALEFVAEMFGHLNGVIITLIPVLNLILSIVGTVLGGAFYYLGEAIKWVAGVIKDFATDWDGTWRKIGQNFAGFFQPVIDFFGGFVKWFQERINDLLRIYNAIPLLADVQLINVNENTNNKVPSVGASTKTATTSVQKSSLPKIAMFADGGLPSMGQMFIARESGAELVGSIGNRTAVMNNSQIVDAVAQGVANAVSSVLNSGSGQNITLVVDENVLGRASINAINKAQRTTGLVLEIA